MDVGRIGECDVGNRVAGVQLGAYARAGWDKTLARLEWELDGGRCGGKDNCCLRGRRSGSNRFQETYLDTGMVGLVCWRRGGAPAGCPETSTVHIEISNAFSATALTGTRPRFTSRLNTLIGPQKTSIAPQSASNIPSDTSFPSLTPLFLNLRPSSRNCVSKPPAAITDFTHLVDDIAREPPPEHVPRPILRNYGESETLHRCCVYLPSPISAKVNNTSEWTEASPKILAPASQSPLEFSPLSLG